NQPYPRHGQICVEVAFHLRTHLANHQVGRVVGNDSGVITERGPDTVRGADVAYYSFERVPRGPLPQGYLEAPPEIVFEVLSPTDRRSKALAKAAEYLEAGVEIVCVLDPERETIALHYQDREEILGRGDQLTFPSHLPGFSVPVRQF